MKWISSAVIGGGPSVIIVWGEAAAGNVVIYLRLVQGDLTVEYADVWYVLHEGESVYMYVDPDGAGNTTVSAHGAQLAVF